MSTEPSPDRRAALLQSLFPMSYISNGLFVIAAVVLVLCGGSFGYLPDYVLSLGALILLFLALGIYRGMRWAMAASVGLALLILLTTLGSWLSGARRLQLVPIFFPLVIMASNSAALYVTRNPPSTETSPEP